MEMETFKLFLSYFASAVDCFGCQWLKFRLSFCGLLRSAKPLQSMSKIEVLFKMLRDGWDEVPRSALPDVYSYGGPRQFHSGMFRECMVVPWHFLIETVENVKTSEGNHTGGSDDNQIVFAQHI